MKRIVTVFLFLCIGTAAAAQNNRVQTKGTIGWYNFFGTFRLSEKFSIHTEYQWRRDQLITSWQQGLLRTGINYQLNPRILLRAGYAWIETFPYGEIPINAAGRDFTEHRIFQMIQLSHKEQSVSISHRFMTEQRFVGRYSSPDLRKEDEFPLLHRIRYMIRLQAPLKGKEIKKGIPYAALYNELFIGFGKNVNANVFDQNRIGFLIGCQLHQNIRIEAGYLNQLLQFGRQINGRNIFQNNNGLIINALVNADLFKNER